MSQHESSFRRANGDMRHAVTGSWVFQVFSVLCSIVVAAVVGIFTATQVEASRFATGLYASLGAGGGWGVAAGFTWVGLLLTAPARQRNELRAARDATEAALQPLPSLQIASQTQAGGFAVGVTNEGSPATFIAQLEEVSGLEPNPNWFVTMPVRLPWAGLTEFVSDKAIAKRGERRFFTGETATARVLGLNYPRQATPPHNLFSVYDLTQGDGWFFAGGLSDDAPAFTATVAILGESIKPHRARFFGMCIERHLSVLPLPLAPTTATERALVGLAERFIEDGRNALATLYSARKTLTEWHARNGMGIGNQFFTALKLAGVLEDQQRTSYDPKGMPYVVDRYQLNEIGRSIVLQLEAMRPTPDKGGLSNG